MASFKMGPWAGNNRLGEWVLIFSRLCIYSLIEPSLGLIKIVPSPATMSPAITVLSSCDIKYEEGSRFNITDDMRVNFLEFLKWIKKISIKNPKYNIIYKHHPNFPENSILDNEENEILKNSNVKKIIKSSNMEINTYDYMNRSKIILSYGSSMILEGISEKKKLFFCKSS